MLFYKVAAMLADKKWAEENNDRRIKTERARQFESKSEEYNEKNGERIFCFVSDVRSDDIVCGIISRDAGGGDNVGGYAGGFLRYLGIAAAEPEVNEITFSSVQSLLGNASRYDYIDDDDEVLERFCLDKLNGRNYRGFDFSESLLNKTADKASLYTAAERVLARNTLRAELERIYSGKSKSRASGHPVHYFLKADDRFTRDEMTETLLQALYANNRVNSRRYCRVDVMPGREISRFVYDTLYQCCTGGAVVVRCSARNDEDDDDACADSEMETITALCETMLKYRNQVLTVFCLPRACERTKKIFYENLGSVSMVEIKEDLADMEKSGAYLKTLCRERHIRPDKKLYACLEPEKRYYPDDLRRMFEDWYNEKMKTSVYPQYRDIGACRMEVVRNTARGNAYDDLKNMIGLREAKEVIGKALNYYRLQRIYKDKGVGQDRPAMHMIFTGNPGTAKTTAARLFARIMRENGLLSKGHLVEVGRGDLVGKYVGWTAQIVKDKFKAAMGGVLFIDEAYALADDRGGSYGDEAINTIVQEMENRREDLVVIFAGYPEEMEAFMQRNPGMRSRIAFHVPFPDYGTEELCEIAKSIGKAKGLTLTDEAIKKLAPVFDSARKNPGFGNGRYVRNVLELSRMNQANRILSMDPDKVTTRMLTTIEAEDIELPEARSEPKKRRMGFVP